MITPSRKTMVDPNLNYSGCRYKMCEVLSLQTGNEVAGYNPLLLKTLITSTEEKKTPKTNIAKYRTTAKCPSISRKRMMLETFYFISRY